MAHDTRESCEWITASLMQGMQAELPPDTLYPLGVLPTPALARVAVQEGAQGAVMISASHNPSHDNGIKILGPHGRKLTAADEAWITNQLKGGPMPHKTSRVPLESLMPAQVLFQSDPEAEAIYRESLRQTLPPDFSLKGIRLVLDAAHGAFFRLAPQILKDLGAEVIAIGIQPDGQNINAACGSTHPEQMRDLTVAHQALLGIALDGDGDRVILSTPQGFVVNGDQMLAFLALSLHQAGRLDPPGVVSTVMANGAFEAFLKAHQIGLHRTPVGDRHVASALEAGRGCLGGEPSGHILLPPWTSSGDGLGVALRVIAELQASGRHADEVFPLFQPYPQIIKNVPFTDKGFLERPETLAFFQAITDDIAPEGRLVVRASGTEPLLRIMVEAPQEEVVNAALSRVSSFLETPQVPPK